MSIEKTLYSLRLVISREFDDKVWDLENMLKYFKKELFVKEHCASLVNEKLYNPNKHKENTVSVPLDETHVDAVRGLMELGGFHSSASASGAHQRDATTSDMDK